MLPIILLAACERRTVGGPKDTTPVLAEVNGKVLTTGEFEMFLPEDYEDVLTVDEKREYLDRWITTQLLFDEVKRLGMDTSEEIEARLEQYHRDLVADQLVQRVINERAVVTDADVRAYYDEHAREYTTEYRVSHILVHSREDAEKVKELLDKRSFEYLARRFSVDKHSGAGGDLGYLSKGNMIQNFEIVFDMQVGEVSDIIESEFGYHLLKVTDIREARFPLGYEDVRHEIANILMLEKRRTVYDSLITTLKSRADIRIVDDVLGGTIADRDAFVDSVASRPELTHE